MRIQEFLDEGLAHSSYVIDLGDEAAAVIDPPRFPTAHQQLAGQPGVRPAWTVDTHSPVRMYETHPRHDRTPVPVDADLES